MIKTLGTMLCVLFASYIGFAQLTVTSIQPADQSTNVPLHDTVSITFSTALDTTAALDSQTGLLTNIDSMFTRFYTPDHRTVKFPVSLNAGTMYFIVVYFAKSDGGSFLESPVVCYFTTGSALTGHTVSGAVQAGSTGSGVDNVLVGLSTVPMSHGSPIIVTGTITNGVGSFTVPYVADGVYWPVAAKDLNHDGNIDGTMGDVIAAGDSIVVAGGNLSGITLTFSLQEPLTYSAAFDTASKAIASLPSDRKLYGVTGWNVDTLGRSAEWEFYYFADSLQHGYRIFAQPFGAWVEPMDTGASYMYRHWRPIPNPEQAADPGLFIANAENGGGRAFRLQSQPDSLSFIRTLNLGSLLWSEFGAYIIDTSRLYWGAAYAWAVDAGRQIYRSSQKIFIGDFSTGGIVTVAGVADGTGRTIPERAELFQNYPNPFNPATTINYSIATASVVSLRVYDLLGREVAVLVNGPVSGGNHQVRFDARSISSGVYFYRLTATSGKGTVTSTVRSMMVLK